MKIKILKILKTFFAAENNSSILKICSSIEPPTSKKAKFLFDFHDFFV